MNQNDVVEYLDPLNSGEIGVTAKEVGNEFGVTRSRAHQILQSLEDDGLVWSSKRGQARVWYPSNFAIKVEDGKVSQMQESVINKFLFRIRRVQ